MHENKIFYDQILHKIKIFSLFYLGLFHRQAQLSQRGFPPAVVGQIAALEQRTRFFFPAEIIE